MEKTHNGEVPISILCLMLKG